MMENLVQLFYDWEIQQLVLLSFFIQMFLFFTGGLRRRRTNIFIRFSIWIAYLGADMIAVYSLGYLSRHDQDAHPLAFFWAPFLLVHLGGQDTITAFAMEDNNLWLRHLLNLAVQVVLAVYVFWKSIGRHNVELLVSGSFLFVVGIIRYGERTWSLRYGQYVSLEDSPGNQYESPMNDSPVRQARAFDDSPSYDNAVCLGLSAMPSVFSLFVSRMTENFDADVSPFIDRLHGVKERPKVLEIGLAIMYDDLYTKALVLRTRSGIIVRCISQICALVAFVVFLACNKGRYGRVDIAITNLLFIGGILLDTCGLISIMASPWTWAWLKAREHDKLAWLSWFLFSSDLIGWPEKRPLWSNAMGQYNLYSWTVGSEPQQPRSFSQKCMTVFIRKVAPLFGLDKTKMFFMSKLFDREHVKVDGVLKCLLDGVSRLRSHGELTNLGSYLIKEANYITDREFGTIILSMHVLTEVHLSKYPPSDMEANEAADTNVLVQDCRKLSRYMMYLMVACPSLLPLDQSSVAMLERWQDREESNWVGGAEDIANTLQPCQEILEEIKKVWIRLIIYAASKSRPEMHAAQLARGGELLTFVWLQLGLYCLGSIRTRIELTNRTPPGWGTIYALNLPQHH